MTQTSKASLFAAMHVPGDPLVLFTIWDVGSARSVASAGAIAIATGSASMAEANGFRDGEEVPLELVLANAERIVRAVDLPVTIDFEGAYGQEPGLVGQNMAALAATGAVGCNFEDQVVGGEGLYAVEQQGRANRGRSRGGRRRVLSQCPHRPVPQG